MNIKNYFMGALAAAALVACSNDPIAAPGNDQGGFSKDIVGSGYISVALNTPTTSSMPTKAVNDEFADGLSSEFRVRQAIIVLFAQENASDTEDKFKYVSAYNIPVNPKMFDPVNDQITSRGVSAIKVANLANNIYALVVANPNGVMTITETGLKLNGGNGTPVVDQTKTFADFTGDFAKVLSTANTLTGADNNEGLTITMCNTPIFQSANANGGGANNPAGKIVTLTKIDATKLFSTEQEALNSTDPTAEIFLERAVAKVTLSAQSGTLTGKSEDKFNYEISGWLLDNTNQSTYLVRNTEGSNDHFGYASPGATDNGKYRFVGYQPFSYNATGAAAPGTNSMYRYYFAKDPNYSTEGTFNDNSKSDFLPIDETRPQYCFENTFDVAHQIWSQTTRVIIRAKFNGGTTFYTINNDDSKLYNKTDETDELKDYLATRVIHYINQMIKADRLKLEDNSETYAPAKWSDDFTITYEENEALQVYTPTATLTTAGEGKFKNHNAGDGKPEQTACRAALSEAFADVREENRHIQKYTNGVCYYQARIKHFGDDLTPWNTWELDKEAVTNPSSGTTDNIYPSDGGYQAARYLGRYGIVRNNWYALNVQSIARIGSPVIPSITGTDGNTPDDELDSYLSIRINIMSWAKRVQNIEF